MTVDRNEFSKGGQMSERFEEWSALAQELSSAWSHAHGGPQGTAIALLGADAFAVLIEGGLTQAERLMLEQPANRLLIEEYMQRLLAQVIQVLAERIEGRHGRRVVSSGVTLDPSGGCIVCFFKLGDQVNPS